MRWWPFITRNWPLGRTPRPPTRWNGTCCNSSAGKLGFPDENFAAHFTSGGSEANLTAALLALARRFPAYLQKGLVGLGTQPTAYVSEYAHNSFDKIVKHVGLGTDALRIIPTNDALQMDPEALRRQLEADVQQGCTPFMVVGHGRYHLGGHH
jgi:glutamate/tyrosine decarboxylase-like PLP-dependent enzyme